MIIIAGMHGSGTRYLSKCFNEVIPMWETEAGGGHFEDKDILAINERELKRHELKWYKGDVKPTKEFIKELKDYKESRKGNYGFKDPRILMFLGAYRDVWKSAKFIVCIRNPIKVIQSHLNNGRLENFATGIEYYSNDIKRITSNIHLFNYDGDIHQEQEKLRKYTKLNIDIVTNWKYK